jgi:hypothetical protein
VIDLNLISIGVGIIATLIGLGWKLGTYLGEIKTSVARIEMLLAAQSARMDRIEDDVKRIEQDVRQIQKDVNWDE